MIYKLWEVYDNGKTEYYIINTRTRRVQSAWKTLITAQHVVRQMNGWRYARYL